MQQYAIVSHESQLCRFPVLITKHDVYELDQHSNNSRLRGIDVTFVLHHIEIISTKAS